MQVRIALLARAGRARQQWRQALQACRAQVVLVADPNTLDVPTLRAALPQSILVALEPAVEDGVSRLGEVLHDPAISVIFDDAELAVQRQDWNAQCWARHLSAKFGHVGEFPSGCEVNEPQILPGSADTMERQHTDLALECFGARTPPGRAASPVSVVGVPAYTEMSLVEVLPETLDIGSSLHLLDDDRPILPSSGHHVDLENGASSGLPPLAPINHQVPGIGESASFVPAPVLHARPPSRPPLGSGQPQVTGTESLQGSLTPSTHLPTPPISYMTLELEALESGLGSVATQGAVVLLAGIGGPDAIRRVLIGLSSDIPCPVLIRLRLDGGRYDNLVRQIAQVSEMPVLLAATDQHGVAGHVYVLPDEVGVRVGADGVVGFIEGASDMSVLLSSLPAAESAVLILSGADVSVVEASLQLAHRGAFVAGQSPQSCYDPAAPRELQLLGGHVAAPETLATALLGHLYR